MKKTFPGNVETVQPASWPQSAWFINNQSQYNPWHTVTFSANVYVWDSLWYPLTQTEIQYGYVLVTGVHL